MFGFHSTAPLTRRGILPSPSTPVLSRLSAQFKAPTPTWPNPEVVIPSVTAFPFVHLLSSPTPKSKSSLSWKVIRIGEVEVECGEIIQRGNVAIIV
ncbi:hypothetical protein LINPERHAP1_LOCUS36788, partial [Linum perenne]